jgi:uncharacterized glyoxalase superfamily protein PhnB
VPQRVQPYLLYEDAGAMIDWLSRAFGFIETRRMLSTDGVTVAHAELAYGDELILLGSPGGDYRNPKQLDARTAMLYIYVDDVDAIFERAQAIGAEVVEEPNDQPYGDRRCGLEDPEGQHWYFAAPIAR